MFKLENLIRNEYFPNELPPCFNSNKLADEAASIIDKLDIGSMKPSAPLQFSGFKTVNSRRRFSIPNPRQYLNGINILVENQEEIFRILNNVDSSLTSPQNKIPNKDEAYKKRVTTISESKREIKKLYQDNLYGLKLDIQFFFDSIYTHSIVWAIHTKRVAKAKRTDSKLLGNKIDKSLQLMNSSQTNGILVGNAFSRIVSELLLCSVDNEINNRNLKINYVRYVDDYYIFTKDRSIIDNVIAVFREIIDKYELVLNENKIEILESPFIYGNSWVEQMKVYSAINIETLLEKSIIEFHKYKDIAILRYALKTIRAYSFSKEEWKQIEPMIFNLFLKFPVLSPSIIIIFKNNFEYLDKILLKKISYSIIDLSIHLRHDEELMWVMWAMKTLKVKISLDYVNRILNTENWLAIIILLDFISNRKNEKGIKKSLTKFRKKIVDEHFFESDEKAMNTNVWLLAYEMDINEWLDTGNSKRDKFRHGRKSNFFKELHAKKISFYDSNYEYELLEKDTFKNNIYVTRKELNSIMEKLNNNGNFFSELSEDEKNDIILESLHSEEKMY